MTRYTGETPRTGGGGFGRDEHTIHDDIPDGHSHPFWAYAAPPDGCVHSERRQEDHHGDPYTGFQHGFAELH